MARMMRSQAERQAEAVAAGRCPEWKYGSGWSDSGGPCDREFTTDEQRQAQLCGPHLRGKRAAETRAAQKAQSQEYARRKRTEAEEVARRFAEVFGLRYVFVGGRPGGLHLEVSVRDAEKMMADIANLGAQVMAIHDRLDGKG